MMHTMKNVFRPWYIPWNSSMCKGNRRETAWRCAKKPKAQLPVPACLSACCKLSDKKKFRIGVSNLGNFIIQLSSVYFNILTIHFFFIFHRSAIISKSLPTIKWEISIEVLTYARRVTSIFLERIPRKHSTRLHHYHFKLFFRRWDKRRTSSCHIVLVSITLHFLLE